MEAPVRICKAVRDRAARLLDVAAFNEELREIGYEEIGAGFGLDSDSLEVCLAYAAWFHVHARIDSKYGEAHSNWAAVDAEAASFLFDGGDPDERAWAQVFQP